jgi:hypothetical protein
VDQAGWQPGRPAIGLGQLDQAPQPATDGQPSTDPTSETAPKSEIGRRILFPLLLRVDQPIEATSDSVYGF